ncbi:hypothetical protein [Chthonobacter rhizosphaerae]|uniref:hypothetical protein n=1 Tax=Chthonobacter rhizosphaerae TaxID=2735553 RepID=UPI0015EEB79F|nr:hypothetical protein [Chthonobacter rhizosphaerae]
MNTTVLATIWICLVMVASGFAGTIWFLDKATKSDDAYLDVLEYEKTDTIYVPVIRQSRIRGYVLLQLVFTADASVLHRMKVDPKPYVTDFAFRLIYADDALDFEKMRKTDLGALTAKVRDAVNERFGTRIVHDVLVEQFGYRRPEELAS